MPLILTPILTLTDLAVGAGEIEIRNARDVDANALVHEVDLEDGEEILRLLVMESLHERRDITAATSTMRFEPDLHRVAERIKANGIQP